MGIVIMGCPPKLSLALRDKYGIKHFVETGTYKAGTTLWAAGEFEQVTTIDSYEPYYREAAKMVLDKGIKNVTLRHGDSRDVLPRVLAELDRPALLWLDAHWCGSWELSVNSSGECPLAEELEAVKACGIAHYILIDDARLFTQPPPYPHDPAQWPTFDEIWGMLPEGYHITVKDDVIIAVPPKAAKLVKEVYG